MFLYKNFSFSLYKTPLGETGCLSIYLFIYLYFFIFLFIYLFFESSGIQFFNSLTCDLRDTMPRQRSLPLLPREAKDFSREDRHFKHVPPLTYLIYLSPKESYVLGLFKRYCYPNMEYNISYEI